MTGNIILSVFDPTLPGITQNVVTESVAILIPVLASDFFIAR